MRLGTNISVRLLLCFGFRRLFFFSVLLLRFRFVHLSFALYEELGSCSQQLIIISASAKYDDIFDDPIDSERFILWCLSLCLCVRVCPVTLNFVFRLIFGRKLASPHYPKRSTNRWTFAEKSIEQPLTCERTQNSAYARKRSDRRKSNEKKKHTKRKKRENKKNLPGKKEKRLKANSTKYFVRLAWCFVSVLFSTFDLHK